MKLPCLTLLCFGLLITGCATIISGPKQRILIQSEPPGAMVFISDVFIDSTPCEIHVTRNFRFTPEVELRKKGYQSKSLNFNKKLNELVILNFILPWNWAVDILTGAIVKYTPAQQIVELKPSKKRI